MSCERQVPSAIHPSASDAVTFCQANFKLMGADLVEMAKHFGQRIVFVHVRDVPVRGDHVPEMEGDRLLTADCVPGYFTLGRLFANGYLKALLKGTKQ